MLDIDLDRVVCFGSVDGGLHLIGKEANKIDEVQTGIVADMGEVLNDHTPTTSPAWFREYILPVLDRYSGRELADRLGVDRRTIACIRRGAATPRRALADAMAQMAAEVAADDLRLGDMQPGGRSKAVLARWRARNVPPQST